MNTPIPHISRRAPNSRGPSDVIPLRFARMTGFSGDPGMSVVNDVPSDTKTPRPLRGCYAPTSAFPSRFRVF